MNNKPRVKDETEEDVAMQHINALKTDIRRTDGDFEEEEITEFDEQMIHESEDGPVFNFGGEPKKKYSPDEARAAFDRHLKRLQDEGKRSFSVKDLYPVLEETGRVRTWIHAELSRRKKNGTVSHNSEDGTYSILSAEDNVGELIDD